MATSALIFLVHGTIPRLGPIRLFKQVKWVTDGSRLCRSLSEAIPNSHCETFMWSGDNSHLEREAAGQNLAAQIAARALQFPCIPILIIAHSHGGNVALYAMRNLPPETRSRIAGIVTLGTPFIWFREHWSGEYKHAVIRGLRNAAIGSAIGGALFSALLITRFRWIELLALLLTIQLWAVYAWMIKVGKLDWNLAARQLIARFQPVLEPNTKLVAVATNVDEAGWWLRLLLLPARVFDALSFMGFRSFARNAATPTELPRTRVRIVVQGGDFASNLIGALLAQIMFLVLEPVMRVVGWLFGCWFAGIMGTTELGLGFIGRLIGRSSPWGFGESWSLPWLAEVWTEALPVGATASGLLQSRTITTLNLQLDAPGQTQLVKFVPRKLCSPHSWLHDDPKVIQFVTQWACDQCAKTTTAPLILDSGEMLMKKQASGGI